MAMFAFVAGCLFLTTAFVLAVTEQEPRSEVRCPLHEKQDLLRGLLLDLRGEDLDDRKVARAVEALDAELSVVLAKAHCAKPCAKAAK
jgi:hypothetical protein